MTLKKLSLSILLGVLAVLVLGGASASATTVLRTDPGGALLTGSTTVTSTAGGSMTLNGGALGSISCAQTSIDVAVSQNSSATSISGTLNGLTFTSCTDTTPVLTFTSCSLHQPGLPTVTITAGSGGGTVTISDATIRCPIGGGFACYFTSASTVGGLSNSASTLAFTNASSISVLPTTDAFGGQPSICSSTQTYGATFSHIVQGGTNRTVTVTTT